MTRAFLALALAACCAAQTCPDYTADSIVNASNYTHGPFAPNSILSLFGTGLSFSTYGIGPDDISGGLMPDRLAGVQVFVDDYPVPLFYVSEGQINFLVPSNHAPDGARVRVVREGVSGPEVTITLADAAPALFVTSDGYAIAAHGADYSLLTEDCPGQAGETVVIYGTGFGKTDPNPGIGEIPQTAAQLQLLSQLTVFLNDSPVDPIHIKYAGVSPGSAGLYQLNLELPDDVGADPQIRLEIAGQSSPTGVKLAVR